MGRVSPFSFFSAGRLVVTAILTVCGGALVFCCSQASAQSLKVITPAVGPVKKSSLSEVIQTHVTTRLLDATGSPLAGKTVTFSAPAVPPNTRYPVVTLASTEVLSDANGYATTLFSVTGSAGPFSIRVASPDTPSASPLDVPFWVIGLNVNAQLVGRSFLRSLELVTVDIERAKAMLASLTSPTPQIKLLQWSSGSTRPQIFNTPVEVSLSDKLTMCATGLKISLPETASSATDGLYQLQVDLDGDGTLETSYWFIRLLGDATGDGQVTAADTGAIQACLLSRYPLPPECRSADTNGDSKINVLDLNISTFQRGRKVPSPPNGEPLA
jgi:hypothetical protein